MDGPRLVQRTCAAWSRPLGSYTYAIPGGVGARLTLASADLARELLANRVFFAGEAAAPLPMHGSLHGAFVSGERAAAHALAAL